MFRDFRNLGRRTVSTPNICDLSVPWFSTVGAFGQMDEALGHPVSPTVNIMESAMGRAHSSKSARSGTPGTRR